MSHSNIIHTVENIKINSWDFLSCPHIEIVVSHKEWDDTVTEIVLSLYFDKFETLADILTNLGNNIVTAMVDNKVAETKVLAEKAKALATE